MAATHAQNGDGEMVVDRLQVKVTGGTPLEQFDIVNMRVKKWIGGIEEKAKLKKDEVVVFGLDSIERSHNLGLNTIDLKVTYIAIIDKKKFK